MLNKTEISSENKNCSFKNAHLLTEFAKALHKVGDEIEKSVGVFDAIGEKNEMFTRLEESMQKPIESIIQMHEITKSQVFTFVYDSLENTFKKHESSFNFVHFVQTQRNELTFFISVKNDKIKETLETLEYDYFISEMSDYFEVNFCFLESDMENELFNTIKLDLNV